MKPKVKILGERSTGTNFLGELIRQNFDCELLPNSSGVLADQLGVVPSRFAGRWSSRRATKEAIQDHNHLAELPRNGGWKHAAATRRFLEGFARPQEAIVFCLLRHPAEWLLSMHRNPFHGIGRVPKGFSEFIRSPWVAAQRDELEERLIKNPIEMVERKSNSYKWLQVNHDRAFVIRYEDVVLSPNEVFNRTPLWSVRKNSEVRLPVSKSRAFGRQDNAGMSYSEKAQRASYVLLATSDRDFVLSELADKTLMEHYPT
jgi:hypothetical protein